MGSWFEFEYGKNKGEGVLVVVKEGFLLFYSGLGIKWEKWREWEKERDRNRWFYKDMDKMGWEFWVY